MTLRAAIGAVCAMLLCGCYDSFDKPGAAERTATPTATIAELHALWFGKPFIAGGDLSVGGYVTSDDRAGNFYRTFTIRDASGGAEIRAGLTDLHNIYPEGSYVCVQLNGCAIGEELGVLQIGLPAESYENFDVDYFHSRPNLDLHVIRTGEMTADAEIPTVGIASLAADMCGLPVTVCALRAVAADNSDVWAGYRAFADPEGRVVYVSTSEYADFAASRVPSESVDITGILQYGRVPNAGDCFMLKMRSLEDCRRHI